MGIAVEIRGLRKAFKRRGGATTHAMDGIDLEVPRGEIFGLLGPNGAGKTSTIKAIAGLLVADSGSISFPAWGRRPKLGAVLEGSRNLYWRLSPWENIRYFGELKGVPLARLRQQSDELLEMFELSTKRDATAQTLSRGMQQKLAVVLALLGDPELLLLDEPTLGLDLHSSLTIQRMLRELASQRGLTILITTHQMDVAQALCRRVAIIRSGRIALSEEVSALVDLFRRQDYAARLTEADWQRLLPELAEGSYTLLPSDRERQINVRFHLGSAGEVYLLMERLSKSSVELLHFAQEEPTLEEIFLHVSQGRAPEPARGSNQDGRAEAPAPSEFGRES